MRGELQAMRKEMRAFLVELGSLEVRQCGLEEHAGHTQSMLGAGHAKTDRLGRSLSDRIDRSEAHLGLGPALHPFFFRTPIASFKAVVNGEGDHLPEAAFYMVGNFSKAVEKAERMAAEAA